MTSDMVGGGEILASRGGGEVALGFSRKCVSVFTWLRVSVGARASVWRGCVKIVEPRAKPSIARGSACYVGRLASRTPVEYQRRVHGTPSHSPPALRKVREKRGGGLQEIAR
ncbi:hypothetical protein HF521_005622 [Silurus meridionalis]|uniref:Uncharacterized protein n=1 Tax=Silurus meridionalis TaxID=175797 RepID=A0A8T0AV84_SILME|nr:hypothetical protein HF521_005622 [Silurus meridionalis]